MTGSHKYTAVLGILLGWALAPFASAEDAPVPPDPAAERIRLEREAVQKNPAITAGPPKVSDELNKIIQDLASQDAAAREAGAKALLKMLEEFVKKAEKPFVPRLAEELSSEDAAVRARAAQTVVDAFNDLKNATPQNFTAAMSKVSSAEAEVSTHARTLLVKAMSDIIEGKLVDKTIEDLAAADAAVAAAAPAKLLAFGAGAAPSLVNALEDERLIVKKGAADILKKLGPAAKDQAGDLAFLLDSDDKSARKLAAAVLENLGPEAAEATDDLVNYLSHDEKSVRRSAANILKKMGPGAKEATGDLVELLTDEDKHARNLAGEVLIALGPHAREGVEALLEIVSDKDNDADSRERAANVLGAIGAEAKDVLLALKAIQDEDAKVKAAVSAAIAKIETK